MSGWKDIATVPENIPVDIWVKAKKRDESGRFTNMRLLPDHLGGGWFGPRRLRPSDKPTHWYDFGDGKPMPDAPEGL